MVVGLLKVQETGRLFIVGKSILEKVVWHTPGDDFASYSVAAKHGVFCFWNVLKPTGIGNVECFKRTSHKGQTLDLLHALEDIVFLKRGRGLQQSFAVLGIHEPEFVGPAVGYLRDQFVTDRVVVGPVIAVDNDVFFKTAINRMKSELAQKRKNSLPTMFF